MDRLNVQVGEEVAFCLGMFNFSIRRVRRVTPSGRIQVEGRDDLIFNPNGRQRGAGASTCTYSVRKLTPALREIIETNMREHERRAGR